MIHHKTKTRIWTKFGKGLMSGPDYVLKNEKNEKFYSEEWKDLSIYIYCLQGWHRMLETAPYPAINWILEWQVWEVFSNMNLNLCPPQFYFLPMVVKLALYEFQVNGHNITHWPNYMIVYMGHRLNQTSHDSHHCKPAIYG